MIYKPCRSLTFIGKRPLALLDSCCHPRASQLISSARTLNIPGTIRTCECFADDSIFVRWLSWDLIPNRLGPFHWHIANLLARETVWQIDWLHSCVTNGGITGWLHPLRSPSNCCSLVSNPFEVDKLLSPLRYLVCYVRSPHVLKLSSASRSI